MSRAERRLVARLREQPFAGEVPAGGRTWPVVAAALAERPAVRGRPRIALRLAPVIAALAIAVALALTPAGPALGDWISSRFTADPVPTTPVFAGLPEGGSALALSDAGTFVARPDGSLRRLGAFSEAGWSPHGLHVVGVSGRRLVAVDPHGTQKWTLARPTRVSHPAWSAGDGFFVAYLEGSALRVVGGNGAGDRLLRRGADPVTPEWRPGAGYELSFARGGRVETVQVPTGAVRWTRPARGVVELAWTRDGQRLAVLLPHELRLLGADGRTARTVPLPARSRASAVALRPDGASAAVLLDQRRGARVVELALRGPSRSRTLFEGVGRVEGIAWSPVGRRLLVAWRDADQWLLIGPGARVRPLSDVSAELGSGSGFPRLAGWCCPR